MRLILYRICLWSANCSKKMNTSIQRQWKQIMIICVSLHSLTWECIFHSSITKTLILSSKITEDNSAEFRLIRNFTGNSYTLKSSLTSIIFTELNLQTCLENHAKIWMLCSTAVSLYAQKITQFLKYFRFSDAYCRSSKQ